MNLRMSNVGLVHSNITWLALCMDESRAYFTGSHTHTHKLKTRLPYFPRAKHSSFTTDSFAAGTESGKCTSILGSYSPITPKKGKKAEYSHFILMIRFASWTELWHGRTKKSLYAFRATVSTENQRWLIKNSGRTSGKRLHLWQYDFIYCCIYIHITKMITKTSVQR